MSRPPSSRGGEYAWPNKNPASMASTQLTIRGFDHRSRIAVTTVIITHRAGSFDLLQRHALLDQVLYPIANNRDHVPVFDNVRLVCEAAMARNDHGSTFLLIFRNRDINDAI